MELPPSPALTRLKRSISYPGEAEPIIEARLKALGMTFQEWVESLMLYDLRLEKPHLLTGDSVRAGGELLWSEWRGVAADFGKTDKDISSLIERKLEELARRGRGEGKSQ